MYHGVRANATAARDISFIVLVLAVIYPHIVNKSEGWGLHLPQPIPQDWHILYSSPYNKNVACWILIGVFPHPSVPIVSHSQEMSLAGP